MNTRFAAVASAVMFGLGAAAGAAGSAPPAAAAAAVRADGPGTGESRFPMHGAGTMQNMPGGMGAMHGGGAMQNMPDGMGAMHGGEDMDAMHEQMRDSMDPALREECDRMHAKMSSSSGRAAGHQRHHRQAQQS